MVGDHQAGERATAAQQEAEKLHKELEDLKRGKRFAPAREGRDRTGDGPDCREARDYAAQEPIRAGMPGEPPKLADHVKLLRAAEAGGAAEGIRSREALRLTRFWPSGRFRPLLGRLFEAQRQIVLSSLYADRD